MQRRLRSAPIELDGDGDEQCDEVGEQPVAELFDSLRGGGGCGGRQRIAFSKLVSCIIESHQCEKDNQVK